MKQTIRKAFTKSLPVMAGYMVLGIGFGILLKDAGYGLIWAFMMILTIYAGSMQYVAVPFLASGASLITVALTTLMVNARHIFYGLTMIDKYKTAGKKKIYLLFSLTAESYSLLCTDEIPDGVDRHWYQLLVSLFDQCYWILGSVLGSLLKELLAFDTAGIDFSMTALFVTVFVEQWLSTKNHWPGMIGLASAAACLVIFGPDSFLLPTMIAITISLLLLRKSGKGEGKEYG